MGPLHQGKALTPQELLQTAWQGNRHRKRIEVAQGRAGDTHTSTLEAVPRVHMGLERKWKQTGAMEYRALGVVGNRVKVSSAGGEQPLPAQQCGLGSYLVMAGESWPAESLETISIPRGGSSRLFSTTPLGLLGSKSWAPSPLHAGHMWYHTAATASLACCWSPAAWGSAGSGVIHSCTGGLFWLGRAVLPREVAQSHEALSPCRPGAPTTPPVCKNRPGCFFSQLVHRHVGS